MSQRTSQLSDIIKTKKKLDKTFDVYKNIVELFEIAVPTFIDVFYYNSGCLGIDCQHEIMF